jgi:hypothetical protein
MSNLIAWIAAEADPKIGTPEIVVAETGIPQSAPKVILPGTQSNAEPAKRKPSTRGLVAHTFPARTPITAAQPPPFAKNAKDGPPTIAQFSPLLFPACQIPILATLPPFAKDAKDGPPGFPLLAKEAGNGAPSGPSELLQVPDEVACEVREDDRERRIYRGRTVAMLRRYMRYSIETGRLPSLLGGEIFRAKVTTYTVVTFEDRVIFVHDMEKCLGRLDEFSRQLIARHILQEHDRWATAKLLHCNEKTVRRYAPLVLDLLSDILLRVGLLKRLDTEPEMSRAKSCQGGKSGAFDASDCEEGKYKS